MLKETLQSIQSNVQDIEKLARSGIKQANRAINISRSERVKNIKKEQNLDLLQLDITNLYQEAIKQKELDEKKSIKGNANNKPGKDKKPIKGDANTKSGDEKDW